MLNNKILLLMIAAHLTGCSLFFNTVKVELPQNYEGWCFIVPVKDTTGLKFGITPDGRYKVNKEGIAYIPYSHMRQEEDLRVEIYRDGKNITEEMQYMGRVATSNSMDSAKYTFVRFLVPSNSEIENIQDDEYWRNNYARRQEGSDIFDSLLTSKRIIFR